MGTFQWLFIGGLSLVIVMGILCILCFSLALTQRMKLRKIGKRHSHHPRKRQHQVVMLQQAQRKRLLQALCFLLLTVGTGGGLLFLKQYQATTLSQVDAQQVSDGYFYLGDTKALLMSLGDQPKEQAESKKSLTQITTALAGYGPKRADTLTTVEGQSKLNRYYAALSELGINLSRQGEMLFQNQAVRNDLLADVEKVSGYQGQIFDYFKVNQAALASQK